VYHCNQNFKYIR